MNEKQLAHVIRLIREARQGQWAYTLVRREKERERERERQREKENRERERVQYTNA